MNILYYLLIYTVSSMCHRELNIRKRQNNIPSDLPSLNKFSTFKINQEDYCKNTGLDERVLFFEQRNISYTGRNNVTIDLYNLYKNYHNKKILDFLVNTNINNHDKLSYLKLNNHYTHEKPFDLYAGGLMNDYLFDF
jgi:hypothetical protein